MNLRQPRRHGRFRAKGAMTSLQRRVIMRRLTIAALGSVIALAVATPAAAQGWDRGGQNEWRDRGEHRERGHDRDQNRRYGRDRRGNQFWGQSYNPYGYQQYDGYSGYDGYNGYNQYGYGQRYQRYDNARRYRHRHHHHDDDD
jgi:hypothetical protein